jgi:hypothetical protein
MGKAKHIFLSAGSALASLIAYDKYSVHEIMEGNKALAKLKSDETAEWNSVTRKVFVLLESDGWSKFWFDKYAKPVFEAGAVDFEVFEKEQVDFVKEIIFNAKEQYKKDTEIEFKLKNPIKGWFSTTSSLTIEEQQEIQMNKILPHLAKLKYNDKVGIICVGPRAWRHALKGLSDGFYESQERFDVPEQSKNQLNPAIKLPSFGFIGSKNSSGFSFFHKRVYGWLNRREMAKQVSDQALAIVNNETRSFTENDSCLGSDQLRSFEKNDETDLEVQKIRETADSFILDDRTIISRLEIYHNKN